MKVIFPQISLFSSSVSHLVEGIAKSVVSGVDVETNPVSNPSQSLHYLYENGSSHNSSHTQQQSWSLKIKEFQIWSEIANANTVSLDTLYWEVSTLNTKVVEDRSLVVFSFQIDFQSNWCFSINCGHNCLRAWFYCWLPPFSLILDLFDEDKLKPLMVVIWNLFF